MEIHVKQWNTLADFADLATVRDAVCAVDPSAFVDTADGGDTLRISAVVGPRELSRALRGAGIVVGPEQFQIMPSVCCGGCSG
jgi:hypothetical protein